MPPPTTPPPPLDGNLPWRWLLLDVDGTLLTNDGRLTPRTEAVLRRAHDAGLTLVLATGRTHASLQRVLGDLPLPYYRITNGGAVALSADGESVRYTAFLAPAQWRRAVRALLAEDLAPLVFSHRHPEAPLFHVSPRRAGAHFERYVRRNRQLCRIEADLAAAPIADVVQVAALGKGPAFDAASARAMAAMSGATQHHSMVLYLDASYGKITEFFAAGVSKWRAFVGLFPEAARCPHAVIAAGDEANDLEMLRRAGVSIAMGNAIQQAKSAAGQVTDCNEADGLAKALEPLLDGAAARHRPVGSPRGRPG